MAALIDPEPVLDLLGGPSRSVDVRLLTRRSTLRPEPGDVLFGNRLSPVQATMNVSKDPWTHCAVVGSGPDGLATRELGPRGCFSRSLPDFFAAYRHVGLARLAGSVACRRAIAIEADAALQAATTSYSWAACTLLESVALARCFAPGRFEPAILRVGVGSARRLAASLGSDRLTCSGFVDRCLSAACAECRPRTVWPRRGRVAPWRAVPSVTDVASARRVAVVTDPDVVRLLSNPTDLWVSDGWETRAVVRPDMTTVLIDLSTPRGRRSRCVVTEHTEGRTG